MLGVCLVLTMRETSCDRRRAAAAAFKNDPEPSEQRQRDLPPDYEGYYP